MGVTDEDKDAVFLRMSGIPKDLWEKWKYESKNGTQEPSVETNTALLEHALRRDKPKHVNLEAYTWLPPAKKAELLALYSTPEDPPAAKK